MAIVSVKCPSCGQDNEIDSAQEVFFCTHCGRQALSRAAISFTDRQMPQIDSELEEALNTLRIQSDEEAEKAAKRTALFLEEGKWNRAHSFCERMLDWNPEDARAYLMELQAKLHVHLPEELAMTDELLEAQQLFQFALRFADDDYLSTLEGYAEAQKAHFYDCAENLGESTEEACIAAAEIFSDLGDYRDAQERAEACRDKAASIREIELQKKLDQARREEREREERERKEKEREEKEKEERERKKREQRERRKQREALRRNELEFEKAKSVANASLAEKAKALEKLQAMEDYEPAQQLTRQYQEEVYAAAHKLYETDEINTYLRAARLFEILGDYKDAAQLATAASEKGQKPRSGARSDAFAIAIVIGIVLGTPLLIILAVGLFFY